MHSSALTSDFSHAGMLCGAWPGASRFTGLLLLSVACGAQAQWTATTATTPTAATPHARPECLAERSSTFKDIPLCDAAYSTPRVSAAPARKPTAHYVLHPHVPLDRRLPPYEPAAAEAPAAPPVPVLQAGGDAQPVAAVPALSPEPAPPLELQLTRAPAPASVPPLAPPATPAKAAAGSAAAVLPQVNTTPAGLDALDAASFPPEVEDTQALGRFRVVVGQSLRQAWESFGAGLHVKTQWAVPDMAAQGNVDIAAISVEDLGQRLVMGAGLAGQELRLQVYHDNAGRLQAARIVSNSP